MVDPRYLGLNGNQMYLVINTMYLEMVANILPIHVSSVKRILNGKGLIKYKDKFKNYEQ